MFAKLFSIKNNANETDKATKPTRVRAEQRRSSMFSIDEYQTTIDMNRNNAIEIHLNDDDFTMHLNEETTSQSDSSSLSRPRKPGMARTRSFSTNAMNHDEFRPGSFVDAADNPKRSKVQSMNMDDMIGKSAKNIKLPSISVEVEQMNFSDPKSPVTNEAEYRNLSTGNPFNSKVAAMAPWRIHSFRASTNIGIDDENRDRFDNTEENWGDPYRDEKTQSISEVESQIGNLHKLEYALGTFYIDKLRKRSFSKFGGYISTIILPTDQYKIRWDMVILALVLYSAFSIPYTASFDVDHSPGAWFEWSMDVIFLFDMYLNARTSYKENGVYVVDLWQIRKHYLQSWFVIDLVSSLPIDETLKLINGVDGLYITMFGMLKILRLGRWGKTLSRLNHVSHGKGFSILLVAFVLIAHWAACLWHIIGSASGEDTSWVYLNHMDKDDSFTVYTSSLYWSLMTITTIGYGDIQSERFEERFYACFVMLIGSLVYALIFAMVSLLLGEIYHAEGEYLKHTKKVSQNMINMALPENLQRRVRRWTSYAIEIERKSSPQFLLKQNMPSSLKQEIVKHSIGKLLDHNRGFASAPIPLLLYLSEKMQLFVSLPREFLIQENEFNQKVFIIRQGLVRIFSQSTIEICRLKRSAHFGEIPLLLRLANQASPISAYCATFVQCYYLEFHDFDQALKIYPNTYQLFKTISKARYRQFGKYDDNVLIEAIYQAFKNDGIVQSKELKESMEKHKASVQQKKAWSRRKSVGDLNSVLNNKKIAAKLKSYGIPNVK